MALSLRRHIKTLTGLLQEITPFVEEAARLIDPDPEGPASRILPGIQQQLTDFNRSWRFTANLLTKSKWRSKGWDDEICSGPNSAATASRVVEEQGVLVIAFARCTQAAVGYLQLASDLQPQTKTHMVIFNQMWTLVELPAQIVLAWPIPWPSPHLKSDPQLYAALDSLFIWLLPFTRGGCSAWNGLQRTLTSAKLRARLAIPLTGTLLCLDRVNHADLATTLPPLFLSRLCCIFAEQFGPELWRISGEETMTAANYGELGAGICHMLIVVIRRALDMYDPATQSKECWAVLSPAAMEIPKLALAISRAFTIDEGSVQGNEMLVNILFASHLWKVALQTKAIHFHWAQHMLGYCYQPYAMRETGPPELYVIARSPIPPVQFLASLITFMPMTKIPMHDALEAMRLLVAE